ncbi:MAG: CopG family transcriptional regulator [Myxococcota bacterium]|nr:CopG family transcriptional regulator [Myxococcota bacterium]
MVDEQKYTDGPIDEIRRVKDFLPDPSELVLKEETVKVTLVLTKTSVDFFKDQARKHNTKYQRMIRNLLDEYAAHQSP